MSTPDELLHRLRKAIALADEAAALARVDGPAHILPRISDAVRLYRALERYRTAFDIVSGVVVDMEDRP